MVKPSKSMQPEQVDEDALQAGRKAVKTGSTRDGSNSFHNYMARKIAVQRQQFGLLLPPPPPPTLPSSTSIQNSCQLQLPASPGKSALLKRDASHVMEEGENETSSPVRNNKKQRAISFGVGTKPPAHSNGQKKRSALTSSKARSMLMRLGKRHGHVQEKQQRIQRLKRHNQDGHSKREDPVGQDGGGINKFSSGSDDVTKNFPKESKSTTEHSFVSCHGLAHKDDGNSDGPLTTTLTAPPSTTTLALQSDADDHDRLQLLTTRKAVPQKCTNVDVEPSTDATCQLDMDSPSTRKHFRPDLFFYGIVIKVQGFTDPDEHTLRRLIQKHGGDYETYETTRVTHIIASAMSTTKQNIYKNQRRPTPVCLPAWIVESAQAGELLPHGKYLLNKEQSQQELHSMFEYSFKNQLKESARIKPPAKEHQTTNEQRTPALESPDSTRRHKHIAQSISTDKQATTVSMPQPLGKTDKQYINGKIRTVGTDPKFVENYFKSSRLSFIGSYRQRIPAASKRKEGDNKSSPAIPDGARRFIFHVDMDQFFAAVVLRKYPEFRNRPVAISHLGLEKGQHVPNESNSNVFKNSTSECATVNYEARKYGIKKGMFLKSAYELCPDLIVLKYDFQGYDEVAQQVLEILEKFCAEPSHPGIVEPISCDEYIMEIFVDASDHDVHEHVISLAENLQTEIYDKTSCTATAGIGTNKYLAKLACDNAKPNGSHFVKDHLSLLSGRLLRDMPGVGWRSEPKLREKGLIRVDDVWELGHEGRNLLCEIMGVKNGERMYRFCHGQDDRDVLPSAERKTVGAECNYGVRFDGPYGIDHFMMELAKEVERRMFGIGVKGSKLTLKIKKRKEDAKEPPKFLGHGRCHNLSKSGSLKQSTRDATIIAAFGMKLFDQFGIVDIHDVRGMGVILSSLCADNKDIQATDTGLQVWLKCSTATKASEPVKEKLSKLGNSDDACISSDDDDKDPLPMEREIGTEWKTTDMNRLFNHEWSMDPLSLPSYGKNDVEDIGSRVPALDKPPVALNQHVQRKQRRTIPAMKSVDLYVEDLVPLSEFLLSNQSGNKSFALARCLCFLTIVQAERPKAIRPLVRMMMKYNMPWQIDTKTIVLILSRIHLFLNGTELDVAWLLGGGGRRQQ